MTADAPAPTDGRRARRERSRLAVVDAAFALVLDGKIPPNVDDVAERAGVSVSSIFRNFDGLDDLQHQAVERFADRYRHLLKAEVRPGVGRSSRVSGFVTCRLDLYEQAGPLMSLGRHRALDYEPMARAVANNRALLAEQTRSFFSEEIADRTPADAADLIASVDSFTSPESFEVMSGAHARTRRQIARAWTTGVRSLIAGWPSRQDAQP